MKIKLKYCSTENQTVKLIQGEYVGVLTGLCPLCEENQELVAAVVLQLLEELSPFAKSVVAEVDGEIKIFFGKSQKAKIRKALIKKGFTIIK